jgi:hypothetical protein
MPRGSCPPGVLCLSNSLLITLLAIAVTGIAVLFYLQNTSAQYLTSNLTQTQELALQPQMPQRKQTVVNVMNQGGDDRYTMAPQPLRSWYGPPEFPPRGGIASIPINIPTQGLPESFQSIGMLHVDGKMLPLFGRRTVGSSDRWNYYTRTDTYNPIPIPLKYQKRDCMDDVGCSELYSGEHVHLEGTGEKGKVTLYRIDGPKYIPGLL